jgi:hypothetical protein|nr:MAG TPA: hypothetical protein [Caudoviricetes sp.]DAW57272.1 MAG TPA: hypothetical protein [Caudoviricetes sp.]
MKYQEFLVPVSIAKELKKIGFDKPCLFYYRNNNIYLEGSASVGFPDDPNEADFVATIDGLEEIVNQDGADWVTVPTYEQVFAWFRGKDLFHSIILTKDFIENDIFFSCEIRNADTDIVTMFTSNTYEEAKIELLKRLIEIYRNEKANI